MSEYRARATVWIDDEDNINFEINTNSEATFLEVKFMLKEFIKAIQWQIDNSDSCPFNPHLDLELVRKKRKLLISGGNQK